MIVFEGARHWATSALPGRDVISALVNLGYAAPQASAAIAAAKQPLGEEATTERLIRAGLKELAKG